jgi:hypothetical protein
MPPLTEAEKLLNGGLEERMHEHVAFCHLNPNTIYDQETGHKTYMADTDVAKAQLHRAFSHRAMEQVARRFGMDPVMRPME